MFKFIIFTVLLIIIFFGFSILRVIFKLFLGKPFTARTSYGGSSGESSDTTTDRENKHKKVFSKDEGEYIDYEEVRD